MNCQRAANIRSRTLRIQTRVRFVTTKGQPHTTIKGGGHFLERDCGEELARVVVAFVGRTVGG